MRYIKSCGVIAYKTLENVNYYLIIRSNNGDFGFPKGHMELGESELETATRELLEETNAKVEIIKGFRHQIEYPIPKQRDIIKQAVYFLGRCTSDRIRPQESEVSEAVFLPYSDALTVLTFEDTKAILKSAEEFIKVNDLNL
jgi:tRNA nucleotidyltransferase (CCA-adding enzyme)